MATNEALKDLDVTNEEVERLQQALKDEQFRKMFVEYAEEISNPENRKLYEEEIAELERNRGMDVKFINPEPAFVIKTCVDGEKKAFINCCKNGNIGKPYSKLTEQNGQSGLQWSIPHSLSPSREDLDKEHNKCTVFDCVFHPDCFTAAEKDPRFKKMIEDTALDGIESEFKVKFDRNNMKHLKNMKYKGRMSTTVIRSANAKGPTTKTDGVSSLNLPYPYDSGCTDFNSNKTTMENSSPFGTKGIKCKETLQNRDKETSSDGQTKPLYTITHRGVLDMQQFVNSPDSRPSTRAQELVIKINLPLLKSAHGIQLDVFEKRLYLESSSPAAYRLDISLPFPVDENHGNAKFDKSKSCMVVTLPVQPPVVPPLPSFAPLIDDKSLVSEEMINVTEWEENNQEKEISPSLNADSEVSSHSESCNTITAIERQEDYTNNASSDMNKNAIITGLKTHQDNDKLEKQNTKADCMEENSAFLNENFILPDFSFHQRKHTISIIAEVPSVLPDTVKTQLSKHGRDCWINFRAAKSDKEEGALYGLQLVFPEGSKMSSITWDVSSSNLVFVLNKEEGFTEELQSFQTGPSKGNLQTKRFPTQHSIEKSMRDLTLDNQKQGKEPKQTEVMSVNVIESDDGASHSNLDIELEVNLKVEKEDYLKDATAADSDLSIDISSSSISEATSSPSPDITPLSPRHLLKSSFRGHRTRSSKSVSFSDEVVVGTFVSSQSHKGRKKSPCIRRSKQKLKAPSQKTCSDSELVLCYKGGEDSEEDLWNIIPPRRTIHRQSSSESESDGLSSSKGKNKKSKGSRRRRKEKSRRALMMEGSSVETKTEENEVFTNGPSKEADVENESSEVSKICQDVLSPGGSEISSSGDGDTSLKSDDQEADVREEDEDDVEDVKEDGEWTTVTKKRHHKSEVDNGEQAPVGCDGEKEEDVVDLEMMDHHTQSAVEFSNQVMFDLDD